MRHLATHRNSKTNCLEVSSPESWKKPNDEGRLVISGLLPHLTSWLEMWIIWHAAIIIQPVGTFLTTPHEQAIWNNSNLRCKPGSFASGWVTALPSEAEAVTWGDVRRGGGGDLHRSIFNGKCSKSHQARKELAPKLINGYFPWCVCVCVWLGGFDTLPSKKMMAWTPDTNCSKQPQCEHPHKHKHSI